MTHLEKDHLNPYVLCYKKIDPNRNLTQLKDCYRNVKSNV